MKILCSTQIGTATIIGQTMRVVAIAKALQRKGHEVKYLAGEKLSPVIKEHGLEVIPLPPMPQVDFLPQAQLIKDERKRTEVMAAFKEIFRLVISAEKSAITSEKPDLLLCGSPTGLLSAKSSGIPCVLTSLQPHGKKTLNYFKQRINGDERAKYIAEIADLLNPGKPVGNIEELVSEVLTVVELVFIEGMPEISGDAALEDLGDWFRPLSDKLVYTGPLLPEMPDEMAPQAELKKRHTGEPAKPLVFVTIGGGSGLIGEEFLAAVLEMFRALPNIKGVIATGLAIKQERLASYNPPPNTVIRGFVPGTELVKASDAVVFHGGSSTLMTCIACGRPAVVIPSMAEQEDNGAVLSQHGAGIVLAKQDLSPTKLADAVLKILTDNSFLSNAQKLKALSKKYGGAAEAANLIEKAINGRLAGAGAYSGSR